MNHYPHNIGDYLKDTLGLSMEQCGAYRRLMDQYYASEAPLPIAREELYGIARCRKPSEERAVEFIVAKYFTETPTGFRHKRCDVELEALIEKSTSASRSAKTRWEKEHAKAYANEDANACANAMLDKKQEPVTKKKRKNTRSANAIPIPEDFAITEELKAWAATKSIQDLQPYIEIFIGRHKASGKEYVDWNQTFMNAVREDWYELRKPKTSGASNGSGWWTSEAATLAKAQELGMTARGGESFNDFRGRIRAKIDS